MCVFQSIHGRLFSLVRHNIYYESVTFHSKYNTIYEKSLQKSIKKGHTTKGCDLFFYNKMWGKECDV